MQLIDFLPKDIRRQRLRRRQFRRQGALMGLCVAALVGLAWSHQVEVARARVVLDMRHASKQNLDASLRLMTQLSRQQAEGQVRLRIARELGSRADALAVLAEVSRLMPDSTALTEADYSTIDWQDPSAVDAAARTARRGLAGGAVSERRTQLVLTGVAPDDVEVANFIGRLAGCPLFENVTLQYSRRVTIDNDRREARGFQLRCLVAR